MTGGEGRSISDCVRLRSAEIGGNLISDVVVGVVELLLSGLVKGEEELKLSNGFDSGGDIRLDTGRRFIVGSVCLVAPKAARLGVSFGGVDIWIQSPETVTRVGN